VAANQSKNGNGPVKKKKISDEFQEEDIFQPPEIVREPSSRQAKLGSNVVLRITANGKPLPSYQWFHNGKKISGANSDRLTLSKVRRAHAGAYHCEAKNHAGKVASRACMLSFFTQKMPKLVLEHRELNIEEGKPITLKLVSQDPEAFKDFKVFWVFNGMRIKGAMGPELSISAGKKKYEGEYKAMIAVGSGLETSNPCKVTIVPAKKAAPPPVPTAKDAPVDATMVGMLAPDASEVALPEPEPAAAAASADDWADSLFNPEDDDEAPAEVVAVEEGTREFDSREIRMSAQEAEAALANAQPSPLDLIASMKKEAEVEEVGEAQSAPTSQAEDDSDLFVDWDKVVPVKAAAIAVVEDKPEPANAVVEELKAEPVITKPAATVTPISESPRRRAPSPKLVKKKEFLENMLARWQKRMGRDSRNAA